MQQPFEQGIRRRPGNRDRDQEHTVPSLIFQGGSRDYSPNKAQSPGQTKTFIQGGTPLKYNSVSTGVRPYPSESFASPGVMTGQRTAPPSASTTPGRGLPRSSMLQRDMQSIVASGTPNKMGEFTPIHERTTAAQSPYMNEDIDTGMAPSYELQRSSMKNNASSLNSNSSSGVMTSTPSRGQHLVVANPLSAEESMWPHWVVVFGFNPNAEPHSPCALQNILRIFQEFGDIEDYSKGSGNWLFIKYISPHEAERAVGMNGAFLSSTTIIGVNRVTPKIARDMNIVIGEDGRVRNQGNRANGVMGRESASSSAFRRSFDPQYEDIMRPPKRSKDICTRIFEYFMAY